MIRKRYRYRDGERELVDHTCDLCHKSAWLGEHVPVGRKILCFPCAWTVMEALSAVYNAPEITALDRVKHRRERGNDGFTKTKAERNQPGYVYYIRMGDLIKIGYAKDVAQRMRAYPPSAQLLAVHPGTVEVEKQIQRQFSDHLARGREWFRDHEDISAHIAKVVAEFGEPGAHAYEYTRPKTQEERVAEMFKTREFADVARGAHLAVD